MFGGSLEQLDDVDLEPLLADVPNSTLPRTDLESGVDMVELLVRTDLSKSKGAARRLLAQGGVYINNVRVKDAGKRLTTGDLATETMIVLRAGKKSYHILRTG